MKRLSGIFLTICMAALLTACGGKTQETGSAEFKPSLDPETSCSITVAGSYDNFEALEQEFDRFGEYYPNVKLSYVKLDDYNNVIGTVLEGNDKPNIFFSYTWMLGNDKYASIFTHTEDLSEASLKMNLGCIRSGLLSHDSAGGVPMVPVFSRTYGMLVNEDLFAKEGLKMPSTWSELLSTCETLKEKGYASPMMGYSLKSSSCFMYTVAYPMFVANLAEDSDALAKASALDPAAGEYMRPALEAVRQLIDAGCIDIAACDAIEDNYSQVILRFFEGDVPMMICAGDTASGTKKRESQSEAFTASPFAYSFAPIPSTEKGGYFIDSPSVEFAVNKECENLEMTNEFMRFLITDKELNQMASAKRLVTPTKDLSFDAVYAPFGKVPAERTISPEVLGITDPMTIQIKEAAFRVGTGELSVEDAISMYGSFE